MSALPSLIRMETVWPRSVGFMLTFWNRLSKAPSFSTIEKIAEVLGTPAWTLFSEYSDKIRDAQEGDELLKFLLKNKINDAIEEVLK